MISFHIMFKLQSLFAFTLVCQIKSHKHGSTNERLGYTGWMFLMFTGERQYQYVGALLNIGMHPKI